MLQKFKLLFLLFFLFCMAGNLYSQITITIKQPPPGKLNVTNLWSVTLNNTSQITYPSMRLKGVLTESTDGEIFSASSSLFSLPPGIKTVTVDDISPITSKFPKAKYKDILIQTGEVPSGNYTICVTAEGQIGTTLGYQCITHSVTIASSITLISPANNFNIEGVSIPPFTWTPIPGQSKKYKFVIAEKNGTPVQSLKIPLKEFVTPGVMLNYTAQTLPLENGKTYYWQVSLEDGSTKSEIWSFTKKSEPLAEIELRSPEKDGKLNTANIQGTPMFRFTWGKAKTNKSITEYRIFIYKVQTGKPLGNEALLTPVYQKNISSFNYNSQYLDHDISVEQGVLSKGSDYYWKVQAFSQSYINSMPDGIVAKSSVNKFNVIGGVDLADNVKEFLIGKYTVKVDSVFNKNPNNFEGKGKVTLWDKGPEITVKFSKLVIEKKSRSWEVKTGEIRSEIAANERKPIKLNNTETQSTIIPENLYLMTTKATLQGIIHSTFPLLTKAQEPNELGIVTTVMKNVKVYSNKVWFDVDPVRKLNLDNILFEKDYEFDLISPAGFRVNFQSIKSAFNVKSNDLTFKLSGYITLPENIKNISFPTEGQRIKMFFENQKSLKFSQDLGNSTINTVITKNKQVGLVVKRVTVDLIPKGSWKGGLRIDQGTISFPYESGYSDIQLSSENTSGDLYFDSKGLTAKATLSGLNYKNKFYGFNCNVKKFSLDMKNNVLNKSEFSGDMIVPLVGVTLNYVIPVTDQGIQKGSIDYDNLGSVYLFGNSPGESDRLNIKFHTASINQNKIIFSADLTLDNTKNENLKTAPMYAAQLSINSQGTLSFENKNAYGWLDLNSYSESDYNGYKTWLSAIKFTHDGSGNYTFNVGGKIILTDDLSNSGGSDFGLTYKFYKKPNVGGSNGEISYANEVEQADINVTFGNSESGFSGALRLYKGDKIWGTGFQSTCSLSVKNPSLMTVASTLMVGKAQQGFVYWFVEVGAEFPNNPIGTGVADLGIYGFKGRVYSRMSHAGSGITQLDYQPDENNTFGIYAEVPLLTMGDGGRRLWGKTAFEVAIGDGFKSTLFGQVYILSDGAGNTGSKIYGEATIEIVAASNLKYFKADFMVNANVDNVVCVDNANINLYFGSDTWYVRLGTPQTPLSMNLYCAGTTATAYVDLEPSNIALGFGYSVDTGVQTWACFYGRAWGGVNVDGNLQYSPFQFTGGAKITGGAELGFYYNLVFRKGHIKVLSGSVTANLSATLPNPVCFAGSISAKGCIFGICKTVTLKLRYKGGSFAFEDHC